MRLAVGKINISGGTQPRAAIDWSVVEEYADSYRSGVAMPPIVVFLDGQTYWLADGFHRVNAAQSAGLEEIAVEVRQGTREDAIWFSLGANQSHGLRRTNADRRRAVLSALQHPKSAGMSDRAIAEHVGVDHKTVAAARAEMAPTGEIPQSPRKGRDGRLLNPSSEKRKKAAQTSAAKRAERDPERESEEPEIERSAPPPPARPGSSYDDVAALAMRLVEAALTLPTSQQDSIVRLVMNRIGSRRVA